MAQELKAFLEDFAQISNYGAIIVVITCLASMFVYIYRISGDMHRRNAELKLLKQTPAQEMGNVYNPFAMSLPHPHKTELQDDVELEVTSHVPCVVKALWGVNINAIYEIIHLPWMEFMEGVTSSKFHPKLDGHVLSYDDEQHFATLDKSQVILSVPKNLDMGAVPRDKYPLVVILLDQDVLSQKHETGQVVCMISLFHIRDDLCSGESNIIAQFVRTADGRQVYNLQQLYMTGQVLSSDPSEQPSEEKSVCVICHTEAVNRVSLPCRHACMCDSCFPKLDRCPMCRGIISSYFTINGERPSSRYSSEEESE